VVLIDAKPWNPTGDIANSSSHHHSSRKAQITRWFFLVTLYRSLLPNHRFCLIRLRLIALDLNHSLAPRSAAPIAHINLFFPLSLISPILCTVHSRTYKSFRTLQFRRAALLQTHLPAAWIDKRIFGICPGYRGLCEQHCDKKNKEHHRGDRRADGCSRERGDIIACARAWGVSRE
jgi:hypothetical protein